MAKIIRFYCDNCGCEILENHEAKHEYEAHGFEINIVMQKRGFKYEGGTIGMSERKVNLLLCLNCNSDFTAKILNLMDPQGECREIKE